MSHTVRKRIQKQARSERNEVELLCCFDSNFKAFVSIGYDNRIKVWDISSGSLSQNFADTSHLSLKYSCIVLGNTELRKKKKKKKNASGVLALATTAGSLYLWNVKRQKIHLSFLPANSDNADSLVSEHSGKINDIRIHEISDSIFSCGIDGFVIQRDIKSGNLLKKFKADKNTISQIALSHNGSYLATGTSIIKIWDLSSWNLFAKFTGHPSSIKQLHFSPDDKYLISSSDNISDRYLFLWSMDPSNNTNTNDELDNIIAQSPIKTFRSDGVLKYVAFNRHHSSSTYHFLAVLSDIKTVSVWVFDEQKKKKKKKIDASNAPIAASLSIKIIGNRSESILRAEFIDSDNILIAFGSSVNTFFKTINYSEYLQNNQQSITISIKDSDDQSNDDNNNNNNNNNDDNDANDDDMKADDNETGALTSNYAKFENNLKESLKASKQSKRVQPSKAVTIVGPATTAFDKSSLSADAAAEDGAEDVPFYQQIKLLEIKKSQAQPPLSASSSSSSSTDDIPRGSVQYVLEQAIHSEDRKLLLKVLMQKDKTIITSTVARLSSQYLVPLLFALVELFGNMRSEQVFVWLTELINIHASFLTRNKIAVELLNGLYKILEEKVSNFNQLLLMKGKVDLVLVTAQVELSKTRIRDSSFKPAVGDNNRNNNKRIRDEENDEAGENEGDDDYDAKAGDKDDDDDEEKEDDEEQEEEEDDGKDAAGDKDEDDDDEDNSDDDTRKPAKKQTKLF